MICGYHYFRKHPYHDLTSRLSKCGMILQVRLVLHHPFLPGAGRCRCCQGTECFWGGGRWMEKGRPQKQLLKGVLGSPISRLITPIIHVFSAICSKWDEITPLKVRGEITLVKPICFRPFVGAIHRVTPFLNWSFLGAHLVECVDGGPNFVTVWLPRFTGLAHEYPWRMHGTNGYIYI